jgi:hypothetical protein
MAASGRRRAMGKVIPLFIIIAFLVAMLVTGITGGISCPPNISSCPSPSVSPYDWHYTPQDSWHDIFHGDL